MPIELLHFGAATAFAAVVIAILFVETERAERAKARQQSRRDRSEA